jgi:hypothetical protein
MKKINETFKKYFEEKPSKPKRKRAPPKPKAAKPKEEEKEPPKKREQKKEEKKFPKGMKDPSGLKETEVVPGLFPESYSSWEEFENCFPIIANLFSNN